MEPIVRARGAYRRQRLEAGKLRACLILVTALVAGSSAPGAFASATPWSRLVPLAPLRSLAERGSGIDGLALAGDSVAWLTGSGTGLEAYVAGSTGPVIDVGGLSVPAGAGIGGGSYQAVLATPSLVAIQLAYINCGGHPNICTPYQLIGAVLPVQGKLHPGPGCDLGKPLAVSGTVVATPARVCDLTTGGSWPLPAGTSAVRLSGDVAAIVLADGSLRVENWRSGAVLYRVPPGPDFTYNTLPPNVDTRQFDVQSDGTAVFGHPAEFEGPAGELYWASPSSPRPHPFFSTKRLDLFGTGGGPISPISPSGPLKLSNGLVAIERTVDFRTSVVVIDLAGRRRTLLPLLGGSRFSSGYAWDFADSRLGSFTRPCQEGAFAVAGVDQVASFQPAPGGPCPAPSLSVGKPELLAGRTLRIGYACPAQAALGCLAESTLTFSVPTARRVPVRTGFWVMRGPLLAADPGTSRQVEVGLAAGALRLLACQRSVSVTVTARGAQSAVQPPVASTPETQVATRLRSHDRRCR